MKNQPVYNFIADDYDNIFVDNLSKAEDKALLKILNPLVIEAIATSNGLILDVGSGTGWLLDHINIPKTNYKGFDISTEMIACSSKKHNGYLFYPKDMKIKWTEKAKLVLSLWTVANYDTPKRQIRYTAQTLLPEGKALFVVHTYGFHREKRRASGKALPLDCYEKDGWRLWTTTEIRQEAKIQGLKVKIIPFRHYKNLPEWLPTFVHTLWIKLKKVNHANAVFLIAIFSK